MLRAFVLAVMLAASAMFALSPSARADAFDNAMTAYTRGDYKTVLAILRPLAEKGDSASQYQLGAMYRFGKGVKKSNSQAVEWYRKSAAQGNSDAQNNLGVMHELGAGVPKSFSTAARWYGKAADKGDPLAMGNLGVLYLKGLGVKQDAARARELFVNGAAQGDKRSKKYLKQL